ncbi:MAG: HAMP domain-containing histidine kinase, partial [Coriobacteriales bacterium]|nr:HAMP domain-containing histidine kinase [Coriobacteriales bacterium]
AALYLFVWRDNAGDWLVLQFQHLFGMSHREALDVYHAVFRRHANIYFFVAVAVVFFVLLRFFLKRFTRYFDEINDGINALIDNRGSPVVLIPEMAAIEAKLNSVRQTLEQRSRDAQLAEQRKNDLVMYLAHDIRTPLTSVIGYLSLLDENPDMSVEQRARHLRIALDKAYRLEQLVDEFFEITRLNSEAIALAKTTVDLHCLLVQVADEFYPQLNTATRQIELHTEGDLTITGDADKLARVFNNILKNAVAYSDPDSTISITATRLERSVSVVFVNSGSIAQEKLLAIFEKFYRLDDARSTGTGGSGLGLAIAQEIVALHEGSISAQSDERQVRFTVVLPADSGSGTDKKGQVA